jgi:hypothetical protein
VKRSFVLAIVLCLAFVVIGKQRLVPDKVVIVPETLTVIDTTNLVKYDTLKISRVYNDTALALKPDTAKAESKPVKIVKVKK